MTDAERSALIASAQAQHDLDAARRRGNLDTYLVGAGIVTTDKLRRNIAVLMSALADDQVWLLAPDPLLWKYTMTDLLWQQVERFVLCVEGPTSDVDEPVMTPNP